MSGDHHTVHTFWHFISCPFWHFISCPQKRVVDIQKAKALAEEYMTPEAFAEVEKLSKDLDRGYKVIQHQIWMMKYDSPAQTTCVKLLTIRMHGTVHRLRTMHCICGYYRHASRLHMQHPCFRLREIGAIMYIYNRSAIYVLCDILVPTR